MGYKIDQDKEDEEDEDDEQLMDVDCEIKQLERSCMRALEALRRARGE